jgi:type II secretory pathway pseudopilin PulG
MHKTFSLIEIVITVSVILILATFGIAGYQEILAISYEKTCTANEQILQRAAELQAGENNDIFPATLGQITPENLLKAYTQIEKKQPLSVKIARAIVRFNHLSNAYAIPFLSINTLSKYGVTAEILHCPADENNNGISYAINNAVAGKKLSDPSIPDGTVIIADAEQTKFNLETELTSRHKHYFGIQEFALGITKQKTIKKISVSYTPGGSKPSKPTKPNLDLNALCPDGNINDCCINACTTAYSNSSDVNICMEECPK